MQSLFSYRPQLFTHITIGWMLLLGSLSAVYGQQTPSDVTINTYQPHIKATRSITIVNGVSIGGGKTMIGEIVPPDVPPVPSMTIDCGLATLTGDVPPAGITYFFQSEPTATSTAYPSPYTVSLDGTYYLRARTDDGRWSEGASSITVTIEPSTSYPLAPSFDANYVVTNAILKEGFTSEGALSNLCVEGKQQSITFLDGLGRPVQKVITQGSPTQKDMVMPIAYDAYGRMARSYLPYASTGTDGNFKVNAIGEQAAFYNQLEGDSKAYVETRYEDSPLSRVAEQGGVGTPYQVGSGHSAGFTYRSNLEGEVRQWTYTFDNESTAEDESKAESSTFYAAGQLSVKETTDENGLLNLSYIDRQGRVVLQKVQKEKNTSAYLSTYMIYDSFGWLRFTLPPEAVNNLPADYTLRYTDSFTDQWLFAYRYDKRGRKAEQKTPGGGATYFVYDKRDQLILKQDAERRKTKAWLFINYDVLGRSIRHGVYTYVNSYTQKGMQDLWDTKNNLYETRAANATGLGYTTSTWPLSTQASVLVMAAYYYDDYDFDLNGTADITYQPLSGNYAPKSFRAKGLPTGSKVRILDTGNYLLSAGFYDREGRLIGAQGDNHLSGRNSISLRYDFAGRLLESAYKQEMLLNGQTQTVQVDKQYTYDHAGRLTALYQKLPTDAAPQKVAGYSYNELGQLVNKVLGENLQAIDYDYTIQGWLKSINSASLGDVQDLFGLELSYENSLNPRYDGTPTSQKWQSKLDNVVRNYDYAFDGLSRLKEASYKAAPASDPSQTLAENFSMSNLSYSDNGNITSLTRKGLLQADPQQFGEIDNLQYHYQQGNQLQYVKDNALPQSGPAGDFKDGNDHVVAAQEYGYDAVGSLIEDKNKGVTSIIYNELGLPKKVLYSSDGANYISYQYDGLGRKLSKQIVTSGSPAVTIDYVGYSILKDKQLQFLHSEEGRILAPNVAGNTAYENEYHYRDHQSNLRVAFRAGATQTSTLTMEPQLATAEETQFSGVATTRQVDVASAHSGVASAHLEKGEGVQKVISVSKGDKLTVEAFAMYRKEKGRGIPLGVQAIRTPDLGAKEKQSLLKTLSLALAITPASQPKREKPQASLKVRYFSKDSTLINQVQQPVSGLAAEQWQPLRLESTAEEEGFALVEITSSGEEQVWTDDMTIEQVEATIVEEYHYDPFGMNLVGIEKAGDNRFQYNEGSEKQQDPTGNGYFYETPLRQYDPQLGRFGGVDLLAEEYATMSPYQYGANNPILFSDPTGARLDNDCADCWGIYTGGGGLDRFSGRIRINTLGGTYTTSSGNTYGGGSGYYYGGGYNDGNGGLTGYSNSSLISLSQATVNWLMGVYNSVPSGTTLYNEGNGHFGYTLGAGLTRNDGRDYIGGYTYNFVEIGDQQTYLNPGYNHPKVEKVINWLEMTTTLSGRGGLVGTGFDMVKWQLLHGEARTFQRTGKFTKNMINTIGAAQALGKVASKIGTAGLFIDTGVTVYKLANGTWQPSDVLSWGINATLTAFAISNPIGLAAVATYTLLDATGTLDPLKQTFNTSINGYFGRTVK